MLCHLVSTISASSCPRLFCFHHRSLQRVASSTASVFHLRPNPSLGRVRDGRQRSSAQVEGVREEEGQATRLEVGGKHWKTSSKGFVGTHPYRLVSPDGKRTVNPASRSRLDTADIALLFNGSSLRDALGRAACEAECLPRKEFFEAWEVGRRVHEHFGELMGEDLMVVDLAAGHGMLAWVLLALEPRLRFALCIDKRKPASAGKLEVSLVRAFPRLAGRVRYAEGDMAALCPHSHSLLVSVHACGSLTDTVLGLAIRGRAPVAVVPCCHVLDSENVGYLHGWMDGAMAMDVERAARLKAAGYVVDTQLIPEEVTPKNRLLLGIPEQRLLKPALGSTTLMREEEEGSGAAVADEMRGTKQRAPSLRPLVWQPKLLPASPWMKFRMNKNEGL